jgi:hypothetical protein
MGIKFPIVMDRWMHCTGHCKKQTRHEVKIYPDAEYQRCSVCLHKQTVRYDRESAEMLRSADKLELEGILADLNFLAGEVATRNWGNIGKKDAAFLQRVNFDLNAIGRRVRRLLES